jgi:hypothetical protein
MKKVDFRNNRILYIGPVYFHYDKRVIKKLTEFGAKVDTFEIYPHIKSFYYRILNKFKLSNLESYKRDFYKPLLSKTNYDYVLVRTGFQLSESLLQQLRANNANAKFINFHWDSITPVYDYTHAIKYFDKIYTFDFKDCQIHKELEYLPLFYLDEYKEHKKNEVASAKKADLLFVGAWRDLERVNLIEKTEMVAEKSNLRFSHYLHLGILDQIRFLRRGIKPKKAHYKSLSHKEILNLFSTTDTIIDFPSSFQTGLTMRTFETLGAGKKLITTNKNIKNEPFYDPDYIEVIDAKNITLNIDFIKKPPPASIKEKMKDYSIEGYINKLFR